MIIVILIVLCLKLIGQIESVQEIRVGALFPKHSGSHISYPELAFQYAVHKLNQDKSLLTDASLVPYIQYIDKDSFKAVRKVCSLVEGGVQAIFSPTDSHLATHINSICDDLDIPDIGVGRSNQDFSVNIHPSQEYVNRAFLDVIHYLNWTRFGILYEKDYGIIKLNKISRSAQGELHIRQVIGSSYFNVLNEFKSKEIHNIIIDINSGGISRLLKNILQQQMNEYKYHYLFTSFDLEIFDLEDFKYNFVNITSFRLLDMGDVAVKEILKDIESFNRYVLQKNKLPYSSKKALTIETQAALMFDSVYIFATGLQSIYPFIQLTNLTCDEDMPWKGGLSLINYINAVEWKGLTGPIQFKEGQRVQFKLDLIKLKQHSIVKVGEWTPHDRLNITDPSIFFDSGSMNVTLVVITILKADLAVGSMTITYARESVIDFTKPFMNLGISILFKVPTSEPTRLFSFMNPLAIEIWIYVLAAYFLVSLSIYMVAKLSPNEWRSIHPCNIDYITIRNQFSISDSFWFTIGTLMQQGSNTYPKAFSTRIISSIWGFFSLIIVASYTANLAAFLTVERMINPIENAEDLASQTEISYGTLDSGSTMTFFRDSMIETYKKMWRSMDNKKPLAFTSTYEDGIRRVNQGNYAFLMESTMLDYIVQRDCNLTQIGGLLDTKAAPKKFLLSDLFFLGYGIATPKGSPWRDKISLAILELQEKGDIQILYDKWWKNIDETCTRRSSKKLSKANALGLENIGGIFVVLIAGILVAFVVAFFEFWIHFRQQAKLVHFNKAHHEHQQPEFDPNFEDKIGGHCSYKSPPRSLRSEMIEEMRFALCCTNGRQRPELQSCDSCSLNEQVKM
ncbi:glutamate receptor ionotropic, kainate 2 isoform X4 [Drosophila busckii]|uniref:glutamate receptor ionotropic, kainate 2 isoform X4 n=1 Tax=Drosophila busckii TaxID=30019 RepID=UPI00083F367B|nr:glutamate receptor ionotropic, kainate 2 isoform X4 [Drosophila busckii]